MSDEQELKTALHSQLLFLRRHLEQLIHVPVKNEYGHIVNGFAAAQIPDWAMKQQIEDIEVVLGKP